MVVLIRCQPSKKKVFTSNFICVLKLSLEVKWILAYQRYENTFSLRNSFWKTNLDFMLFEFLHFTLSTKLGVKCEWKIFRIETNSFSSLFSRFTVKLFLRNVKPLRQKLVCKLNKQRDLHKVLAFDKSNSFFFIYSQTCIKNHPRTMTTCQERPAWTLAWPNF
jgi:hypothetical protein